MNKIRHAWNKGKKVPQQSGINHPLWQGDNVGYRSLHQWVQRHLGKADLCSECGLDAIPVGKKRYFTWANISNKYKRDLTDWKKLCFPCHARYDNWLGKMWKVRKAKKTSIRLLTTLDR